MSALRTRLLFLNIGHAFDHLFMLLFATAVLVMVVEFGRSYDELLVLATPGFIAFGAGAIPAGWLGDRWSRNGMMVIFFIGIGAASILTGLASAPFGIAIGLFLIGVFASIYHPVGIAMVAAGPTETVGRRLGVNGVYGNMGVASAALVAGALANWVSWRAAFILPGVLSILVGIGFLMFIRSAPTVEGGGRPQKKGVGLTPGWQRVIVILVVTTLLGGIVFNATTVSLPKVFDERLADMVATPFGVGVLASIVYAIAAFTQIPVGRAIDKHAIRPIFVVLAVGQVAALLLAATAWNWAMFGAALLIMIMVFGQIPIGDALIARYTPDVYRSRVYSIKYVLSLGVASLAVPTVALVYRFGGGLLSLFLVLAAGSAIIAAAAFMLPGSLGQQAAPAPAE